MNNGIKSEVGSNKYWEQKSLSIKRDGIKTAGTKKALGTKRPGSNSTWHQKSLVIVMHLILVTNALDVIAIHIFLLFELYNFESMTHTV